MAKEDRITSITSMRLLMTATLVLVAVAFGLGTYFGLRNSERSFASSQFDSVADNALTGLEDSFNRMEKAMYALSSLYSNQFPDETKWPFVTLPVFYETVPYLTEISNVNTFGFLPRVAPELLANTSEQTTFEKYLFDYFESDPAIPNDNPPGLNLPGFGYGGIWGNANRSFTNNAFGNAYRDLTGVAPWTGPDHSLYPAAQLVFGAGAVPPMLARNFHSDPFIGPVLSEITRCADNFNGTYLEAMASCPGVRPSSADYDGRGFLDVSGNMAVPIFLRNASTSTSLKLVGLIAGSFSWTDILTLLVPAYEGDVDVVVTGAGYYEASEISDDYTFTYTIIDGAGSFSGVGDLHDKEYNDFGRVVEDMQFMNTFTYKVTMYPRKSFVEKYETQNPLYVPIGSVLLICLCSLVFIGYDYAVSRHSVYQQVELDTKRKFVRYISHEVRTPLNTVKLGLKLFLNRSWQR